MRMFRRDFIAAGALALLGTAPALAQQSRKAAARAPVILVVGDSLSAEYGLRRGSGWVQILQERMIKEGIPARMVNAGISADTTSGGRSRLPALLRLHKPAVVIIELGANDALRGLPLEPAQANLQRIIDAARAAGARVLLTGVEIPPNYGPEYAGAFRAMFAALAQDNDLAFVPFLLAPIATDLSQFQADTIHPVAEAQPMVLDHVWPALVPLLD